VTAVDTTTEVVITEPGVYDIPADVYHADPVAGGSLSSSEARMMLPPSCPRLYRWAKDHPEHAQTKKAWDFGSAAHRLVLGAGDPIRRVELPNWKTKKAQEQRDEARAAGEIPLLAHDHDVVLAMAEALRSHPVANALFSGGRPEQTLVWRDQRTGVMCRALVDWLRGVDTHGRLIIPDYKTAVSGARSKWAKAAADYGYHLQADHYTDGAEELDLAEAVRFVFVVQEKSAPYLVSVYELDAEAMRKGRELNTWARQRYASCMETGEWPGHVERIEQIELPVWATREDAGWQ